MCDKFRFLLCTDSYCFKKLFHTHCDQRNSGIFVLYCRVLLFNVHIRKKRFSRHQENAYNVNIIRVQEIYWNMGEEHTLGRTVTHTYTHVHIHYGQFGDASHPKTSLWTGGGTEKHRNIQQRKTEKLKIWENEWSPNIQCVHSPICCPREELTG